MKKSYLMIAAAAALFAACGEKDTFKDVDTQDSPIAFDQAINKVTRAYIENEEDLAGEGGFVVYGFKTLNNWTSIAQNVYSNQGTNVKSNDNGVTWYYDNLRFWDKTGKYNFYAVAPYGASATYTINSTLGASFGYITITGAASAKNANSADYLLARGGVLDELGSNHTSADNDPVTFDFHHVMTKVMVKLKSTLDAPYGHIKVTSLAISGWNSNTGTFAQNSASTPNNTLDNSEWTITAQSPLAGNFDLVGTGCTDTDITITCDKNSAAANTETVQDFCIMVPQNIATDQLTFTLDYTYYNDENDTHTDALNDDYNEAYPAQVAVVPSAQTWGTDACIIYTIDIKPASIDFDVDEICNFDAKEQSYGPVTVE